ncbi:hypothetical protein GC170_09355 [bacterium]|nr:hypothetical protein [bacterium]
MSRAGRKMRASLPEIVAATPFAAEFLVLSEVQPSAQPEFTEVTSAAHAQSYRMVHGIDGLQLRKARTRNDRKFAGGNRDPTSQVIPSSKDRV